MQPMKKSMKEAKIATENTIMDAGKEAVGPKSTAKAAK
jgi:hypothetical protein